MFNVINESRYHGASKLSQLFDAVALSYSSDWDLLVHDGADGGISMKVEVYEPFLCLSRIQIRKCV